MYAQSKSRSTQYAEKKFNDQDKVLIKLFSVHGYTNILFGLSMQEPMNIVPVSYHV